MKITAQDIQNLAKRIPAGFQLKTAADGTYLIYHRRTGMGCMNDFVLIFWAVWLCGSASLLERYLNGGTTEGGLPISIWSVITYWLVELIVTGLLLYLRFSRKIYRLEKDFLVVETRILLLKWQRRIKRESIRRLVQYIDGGQDEDSFPSWGLRIESRVNAHLLYRQPYPVSHWLGQILAYWADATFVEAPMGP
ncbi:hypothetical protein JW935_06605 [candidate division KSB1 bacterium]|nr:hypothetical protein [candidate division KSB1 bacterium]